MAPSSQNFSSTHASHNNRFIRRGHNSEIRRTPYGTERSRNHRRDRRGYRSRNPFQFTGTAHIHTAIIITDAESFSLHPRDWNYPQPSGGFTGGAQMNAVRPGSVTSGYNLGGPGANLTPGGQTPAIGLGPAGSSGVGYNQLTPNATLGAAPPAVGLGLNNGGFTSGAQMDAVRPGSVKGGYNPGGPGASLTPCGQTPAVGPGPAGSSGVGSSQLSPIVTLGFEGQTSQAPFLQEYDTQAAPPPPTLDQQLFPPSWVTAANNAFAEDFLPPAVSDNFMHMLNNLH